MTLPEISIRRHVLAWMISGIFVLFGIISIQKIGLDRFPMIEFPILSVTTTLEGANPEIIDATHERMRESFHSDGGNWQRRDMPRTSFVFLNAEKNLTPEQQSAAANQEAKAALGAYWNALEGTIDPSKVENAAQNALIGNVEEVAQQILQRFHPQDRIMAWFDFFNHDSNRVCRDMTAYMEQVVPRVEKILSER